LKLKEFLLNDFCHEFQNGTYQNSSIFYCDRSIHRLSEAFSAADAVRVQAGIDVCRTVRLPKPVHPITALLEDCNVLAAHDDTLGADMLQRTNILFEIVNRHLIKSVRLALCHDPVYSNTPFQKCGQGECSFTGNLIRIGIEVTPTSIIELILMGGSPVELSLPGVTLGGKGR
jgi:hypothetical protein